MNIFVSLFFALLVLTGCSSKQAQDIDTKVKYIYKIKYVYLPCEDRNTTKHIKVIPNKPKIKKLTTKKKKLYRINPASTSITLKYKQPMPTEIYAPEEFTTRPNQKMNFMVGINKDKSKFLYMEGEFDIDTYKNFLKFKKSIDPKIKEIKINSNGGVVLSAMRIGAFIKEKGWRTGLDKEMHCYSACGFVYFAGKEKSIQGEAKIGLHRPYIPNKPDTPQSIRKIKKDYISYWRYINAPMDLYYEMMEVPRDDLLMLDKDDLEDYIEIKTIN